MLFVNLNIYIKRVLSNFKINCSILNEISFISNVLSIIFSSISKLNWINLEFLSICFKTIKYLSNIVN